ncbi:MAG: VanW family protein [Pseudomonadota bacterium]
MPILISMILIASTLAAAEPRFGLDRDPVCVASALAEGNLRVLLPGDPMSPPCAWSGEAAFALELGRCHTRYSWWNGARSHNLEKAARAIDGVVLRPGETFSFNRRVGERTEATGYREAKVIAHYGYADGVGGGICQVASTLYGAALFAGLEEVERSPHRFRVAYTRLGLDATVDYDKKDLKLRNPFPFPVRLELGRTGKGELMARVSGPMELVVTRYRYKLEEVTDSDRVRFKKVAAPKDVLVYYGRPGITLERLKSQRTVFQQEWSRSKLGKDQYQASPWELEVAVYPGGKKTLRGATKKQIAGLLKGTKYKVADAMYQDLEEKDSKWLRPDYVSGKRLRQFERFNQPAAVAASD